MDCAGAFHKLSPYKPVSALVRAAALAKTGYDKHNRLSLIRQVKYTRMHFTSRATQGKECIIVRNTMQNPTTTITCTPLALLRLVVVTQRQGMEAE